MIQNISGTDELDDRIAVAVIAAVQLFIDEETNLNFSKDSLQLSEWNLTRWSNFRNSNSGYLNSWNNNYGF